MTGRQRGKKFTLEGKGLVERRVVGIFRSGNFLCFVRCSSFGNFLVRNWI